MLLLKLLLTPVIIVAVTLVGRRWGPRAAGLLVGLPVTTGPVSVFLALERGPLFASRAAAGAVEGLIGTATFCTAYALVARRRDWPAALAGALATLCTATLLLRARPLSLAEAVPLAVVALLGMWGALTRVPAHEAGETAAAAPRAWDLPARVVVSTVMVAGVTSAAGLLGSQLSGMLSALPVMGAVLGTFTHHGEGRGSAISLMRGLVIGCLSGVAFFSVVGAALAPGALASTYAAATLAALLTGAAVSRLDGAPAAAEPVDAPAPVAARKVA